MSRLKTIIYWLATTYILFRGIQMLGEVAEHNIGFKFIEAIIYMLIGIFGVWINTKVKENH